MLQSKAHRRITHHASRITHHASCDPVICSPCTAELSHAAAPSWPSGWQNEKAQACDEHGRLYECDEDGWPLEPLQYKAHMPPATQTSPGMLLLSPELIKAATDAFTAASPGAAPAAAGEHMKQLQLHQGPQHTTLHCCLHPAAIEALIKALSGHGPLSGGTIAGQVSKQQLHQGPHSFSQSR
jgi:hypothetical protein